MRRVLLPAQISWTNKPLRTFFISTLLATVFFSHDTHAQSERRQLIRQCVEITTSEQQISSAITVENSGGVTCPPGDIVGFPPRERKHNRSGSISVQMGSGRVVCPGTVPELTNVSDNGGHRGNYQFATDGTSVSLQISCSGAGVGQGRRWFNATLRARSCVRITEDMILDATLACAEKLN